MNEGFSFINSPFVKHSFVFAKRLIFLLHAHEEAYPHFQNSQGFPTEYNHLNNEYDPH